MIDLPVHSDDLTREELRRSPARRQAAEERRKAQHAERQRLAKRRTSKQRELAALVDRLQTDLAGAYEARDAAKGALVEAQRAARHAYARRRSVPLALEHELARLEDELIATADPAIGELRRRLEEQWEAGFGSTLEVGDILVGYRALGRRIFERRSTAASLEARMTAIRDAQRQLEALALEPLDSQALRKRLGDIVSGIPGVSLDVSGAIEEEVEAPVPRRGDAAWTGEPE